MGFPPTKPTLARLLFSWSKGKHCGCLEVSKQPGNGNSGCVSALELQIIKVIRDKHTVMNNMTSNQDIKFQTYIKRAWAIYALITIALIVILVFFVAQDTEERFFFTIMPAAAAYVFRPTNRYLGKIIFKFTGVSQPAENE